MLIVIAVVLAIFAGLAKSAKMNGVAKFAGIAAFLVFIGWLASGPGFAMLDFVKNPSVNVPDNIPIPGGK